MFYSESAVRRAETIILNLLFCFILLCPIIILSFVHDKVSKLGIVFCFVLAASVLASDLSNAANKTNMAVIAAWVSHSSPFRSGAINRVDVADSYRYAAILVVALSSTIGS